MVNLLNLQDSPVTLRTDGFLEFGPGVMAPDPEPRTRVDIAEVLLYPSKAALMFCTTCTGAQASTVTEWPWLTQGSGMT